MRMFIPALLLVLIGTAPALAQRGEVFYDRSFSFDRGDRVEVATSSPDIIIETRSGREANVRVEGTGRRAGDLFEHLQFSAERRGDRLVVRTDPRGRFTSIGGAPDLRIIISIPERADLDLRTSSGSITIPNIRGNVAASASSGNIRTADLNSGTITLRTSSGNVRTGALTASSGISTNSSSGRVEIESARANTFEHRSSSGDLRGGAFEVERFEARTSSGDMRLEGITGTIDARSSSGRLDLGQVAGDVSARTASGNIEMALLRDAPVDLRSSSGDVSLTALRTMRANLSLNGRNFDVSRDLNFDGRQDGRGMRGTLNGGGPELSVQSSSGRIRIQSR